ncbi:MAG: histidine phosphatase family protein [Flavobacteriales bacterium]|nr:histidine phosphatase family protein [Flavobacteriales bacterium]
MTTIIARFLFAAPVLVLLAHCASRPLAQSPMTTVYVVRHAEKLDPSDSDSPISPAGEERAKALAQRLAKAGITRIHATTFVRTQQTVAPLARLRSITPELYEPFDLDPLVVRILGKDRGQAILIAGHNITVPGIVERLSGQPVDGIPEGVYDRFFKVTIAPDGAATLEQLTYGEPSGQ